MICRQKRKQRPLDEPYREGSLPLLDTGCVTVGIIREHKEIYKHKAGSLRHFKRSYRVQLDVIQKRLIVESALLALQYCDHEMDLYSQNRRPNQIEKRSVNHGFIKFY